MAGCHRPGQDVLRLRWGGWWALCEHRPWGHRGHRAELRPGAGGVRCSRPSGRGGVRLMYVGYMEYGDRELFNNNRFDAYANTLVRTLNVRACDTCDSLDEEYVDPVT